MHKRAARLVLRRPTASLPAALLACALLGSLSASATTIPPDLAARADQLRQEASPQVLAWVGEQARALAKGRGPVDVVALKATARARFGVKQASPGKSPVIVDIRDRDVEALAQLVLMECAKETEADQKAVLNEMKANNARKAEIREFTSRAKKTPTPTPAPDRTAEFVAQARSLMDKTRGARLSLVVPR